MLDVQLVGNLLLVLLYVTIARLAADQHNNLCRCVCAALCFVKTTNKASVQESMDGFAMHSELTLDIAVGQLCQFDTAMGG
jgi:hypothetical protein